MKPRHVSYLLGTARRLGSLLQLYQAVSWGSGQGRKKLVQVSVIQNFLTGTCTEAWGPHWFWVPLDGSTNTPPTTTSRTPLLPTSESSIAIERIKSCMSLYVMYRWTMFNFFLTVTTPTYPTGGSTTTMLCSGQQRERYVPIPKHFRLYNYLLPAWNGNPWEDRTLPQRPRTVLEEVGGQGGVIGMIEVLARKI